VSAAPGRGLAAWTRFWFAREPSQRLALLRIFFGAAVLFQAIGVHGLYRLPHVRAGLPRHFAPDEYPLDAFRLPWPGLEWLPAPGYEAYRALEIALVPLAALFTAGLFTRVAGPLLALTFAYLFALSQLTYHHHLFLFLLGLLALGFSPAGDHYGLDAYLAGRARPRPLRMVLPVRLIQVLLPLVYLFSGLQKLTPGWTSGEYVRLLGQGGWFQGPVSAAMLAVASPRALGLLTIATELLLAVGLCVPRLRRAALWVAVAFHLTIDLTMEVRGYSWAMLALLVAYAAPGPPRTVALYDGACGFCGRSVRAANLLDWLRRVRWVDFRVPGAAEAAGGPAPAVLEREMAVVRSDGSVLRGFDAWRDLLGRFPATFLAAPLLRVPPVARAGRAAYARIAAERFCLAGGACEIQPPPASRAAA
jgi:predicted DCC family thiol-disulfide oxidoreductase YuxK